MVKKLIDTIKLIPKALKIYYSAPLQHTFRKFRNGLIYFSVGLIIIYYGNMNLEPSLQQELIILAGIILSAIGFLIAMMAQMKMLISRIVAFLQKK